MKPQNNEISFKNAAEIAQVSVATIRNWIKTGYLNITSAGNVDFEGFNKFMDEVAGKEKLNSRANKLKKDEHNHKKLSLEIERKIKNTGKNSDKLGNEYELSLSNSYRNKEGIYYTPSEIVKDMMKNLIVDEFTTFCDPCCGSGNFIIEALNIGIKPENIYGYDLDTNAVEITKKRIFNKTGYKSRNIVSVDFLKYTSSQNFADLSFDLIFTNPPWGKKINIKEKERYGSIFGSGKSIDTSSLFLFASLKILKNNGKLGFLLPEAFFNIATFEDVREKILQYKIERIVDYGKSFKGLLTKTQAVILKKVNSENSENFENKIICQSNNKIFSRTAESFQKNPKKIFNFWLNSQSSEIIEHLYKLPHITLENKAKWALGIVTGNNKQHCSCQIKNDYVPVYKGSDITTAGLKEPSCYIPHHFSKYQQVAPLEMYEAPVKIIYKFITSNPVFFCDTQQRFILNSANILIPDNSIGITPQQLCDLLNSRLINWLFKSIFNTHKILRRDLESLPLHTGYFANYQCFEEQTFLDYLHIRQTKEGTYKIVRSV